MFWFKDLGLGKRNWRRRCVLSKDPTELKQALADVDKAEDVVDLLVVLLKICRRHSNRVVNAGQTRQIRQDIATVCEHATAAFTSVGLSQTTRALVKEKLNEGTDLAVTARALALGIDEAITKRDPKVYVKACAKWQHQHMLVEDDPYPTQSVDLKAMYGEVGFSRRPQRDGATAFDRVGGMALWPAAGFQPLRVIYDTAAGAYLDNALAGRGQISILAVLPNGRFDEFRAQFTADSFFGMHPDNTAVQNTRIDDGVRKAGELDVDIMVTPELSSTPDTVKNVRTALRKAGGKGPRVVIAGGLHVAPSRDERRNRLSTIYADPNAPIFEHDKIGKFVAGKLEEDIDRSTTLTIQAGINWSMITLICADLLDDIVVDAVADLSPRLVIVPSMSEKTGDFELSAAEVIRRTQALVMVVNGPHDWYEFDPPFKRIAVPCLVVGMPLAASRTIIKSAPPFLAPPFGVLFRSEDRSARYVSL